MTEDELKAKIAEVSKHPIVPEIGKESLTKLFTEVKDSGARTEFSTGAVRDIQEDKGRFDLLPYDALERLAILYERGSRKYSPNNWRKGIPLRTYLNSAARHLHKLIDGWDDEDHAAAVMFNVAGFITTQNLINKGILSSELDDLDYKKTWDAPKVKVNENL